MDITLTVNGREERLSVSTTEPLLNVLRDRLELTGARRGCETNYCGCCSVLLDGVLVHSCAVLAAGLDGRAVQTVEGLETEDGLSPLQTAFIEHGAIQCGYCTPGMLMAGTALLAENPRPGREEAREAIAGNLCRCTGYTKIVEAIVRCGEAGL